MPRKQLSIDDYVAGILAGNRTILARAITLVESNLPKHRKMAQKLLTQLMPHTGKAFRVGITGVPGVGKSTFIEQLGQNLLTQDHRVAVLAIDPTSVLRGGSILGDKTRMARLSADPKAFIRPSPSQGSLGGVHRKTRETILLCEAAGFDVILIETVGVGQSEVTVASMVDTYLVLMLANAGDELQGLKKGILEIADIIAINKADGGHEQSAFKARQQYESALHFTSPPDAVWKTPVLTCSALDNKGIDEIWQTIVQHRQTLQKHGLFEKKRQQQRLQWLWALIEEELLSSLRHHENVRALLPSIEAQILKGTLPPTLGAEKILGAFGLPQFSDL